MATNKYAKAIGILGIIIILSGIGSFVAGCVWVGIFSSRGLTTDGSGIWSGILLILAGILGLVGWKAHNRGLDIAFLVLCIIACIAASIQTLIAGLAQAVYALHSDKDCYVLSSGYCSCTNSRGQRVDFRFDRTCELVSTYFRGLISILTFNVLGAFFTLVGSIYGCMAACENQTPAHGVVVNQPGVVYQTGQPVVYVQQQPGVQPGVQPQYNMGYAQQPAANSQATPGSAGAMPYQPSDPPPHYVEKE